MKTGLLTIFTLITACAYQLAHAESAQQQGASLEAHVHGTSEMTIAIEGRSLEVQITSPAMNMLGFEHKAHTKEDITAVEKVVSLLGKHDTLLTITGDRCTLVSTSVDVSSIIDNHHDEHEHDAKPDEEHHSEHDNHSEIIADYHYNCENEGKLSSMTVGLFEAFSGLHQLRVMWITKEKQGAVTLNAELNTIILR